MNASPAYGKFITFEGGEGAGKSTQIIALATKLTAAGITCITTREPGGSPGAEEIRNLLVTGEVGRWSAMTEALLFAAARDDHLNRTIRPALEAGTWVLCDRFSDSTRAYQGAAEGLSPEIIEALDQLVVGTTQPDLTLIMDLPVEEGLARATSGEDGDENRFERMGLAFHERLRMAFIVIAREAPERCAIIDATQSKEDVASAVWDVMREKFSALMEAG